MVGKGPNKDSGSIQGARNGRNDQPTSDISRCSFIYGGRQYVSEKQSQAEGIFLQSNAMLLACQRHLALSDCFRQKCPPSPTKSHPSLWWVIEDTFILSRDCIFSFIAALSGHHCIFHRGQKSPLVFDTIFVCSSEIRSADSVREHTKRLFHIGITSIVSIIEGFISREGGRRWRHRSVSILHGLVCRDTHPAAFLQRESEIYINIYSAYTPNCRPLGLFR